MANPAQTRTLRWAALWVSWMVLISIASHVPGEVVPEAPFEGADKAAHIAAYFVLGVLGVGAVARLRADWPRPLVGSMALVVGALFGALDEFHQSFVAGRQMDMKDWLTDLLGLALAVIIARAARGGLARWWLAAEEPPASEESG